MTNASSGGVNATLVELVTRSLLPPSAHLGTLFTVPLAVATSAAVIAHLRASGVRLLAATPAGAIAHFAADMTGPVALVIGSEQYGITPVWLDAADQAVVIPMPGSVDSLNAAMAAGILLFEAVRQRTT